MFRRTFLQRLIAGAAGLAALWHRDSEIPNPCPANPDTPERLIETYPYVSEGREHEFPLTAQMFAYRGIQVRLPHLGLGQPHPDHPTLRLTTVRITSPDPIEPGGWTTNPTITLEYLSPAAIEAEIAARNGITSSNKSSER